MGTGLGPFVLLATVTAAAATAGEAEEGKLHIICFGAHPDDCEIQAGGASA